MKSFLIITISTLQVVAKMRHTSYRQSLAKHWATSMSEPESPLSHEEVIDVEEVPEMPTNVVDFQAARNRILDRRSREMGVSNE